MREIKFRGKRIDNGEWVYGDLIQYDNNEYKILEPFFRQWDILEGGYDVIPESVGQYTGLKDKDGKEIYEGDIIRILYTDWPSQSDYSIPLEEWKKSISKIGHVIYSAPEFCLYFIKGYTDNIYEGKHGEKEVIGNVSDNPELLK